MSSLVKVKRNLSARFGDLVLKDYQIDAISYNMIILLINLLILLIKYYFINIINFNFIN